MKIKNKFWKFALSGLAITAAASSVAVVLTSCATNNNNNDDNQSDATLNTIYYKADPTKGNLFENVAGNGKQQLNIDFSNYIKSLLMNPDVSKNFYNGVSNLAILLWFKNVAEADPNSKVANTYESWLKEIGLDPFTGEEIEAAKNKGTAQEALKTYEDKYGKNWERYAQNEAYNKVGGNKLAWIQSKYFEKVQSAFVENLFNDDNMYMRAKEGSNTFILNKNFANNVDNPQFVNGGGATTLADDAKIGTKNNFIFTPEDTGSPSTSNNYKLAAGYSDFIDFALDQYVATEMPLMSNMALFKPTAPLDGELSNYFNVSYFGKDTIGTEASYKFQCYAPSTGDMNGTIDVIGKWGGAIEQLSPGSSKTAINSATGAINISKAYTDDSSTYMVNNATKIFSDTVTPFAAAVAYKFNTIWATDPTTGGFIDNQVLNLPLNKVNKAEIMDNFLVYGKIADNSGSIWTSNDTSNSNGNGFNLTKNYLKFPFNATQAFNGTNYEGATGIIDTINLTNGTDTNTQSPFMITRNEFGIHIIGIDRYNALTLAAKKSTAATNKDKLNAVRNEIRNTLTYRYAKYLVNNNDTVNGFDLKEKLQTYVTDNLSSLIIKYMAETGRTKDLFNVKSLGLINSTEKSNSIIDIDLNQQIKDAGVSYINLQNARNVQSIMDTINTKMYENQSAYLNNSKPEDWKNNGIAGVLPYTRSNDGNFNTLLLNPAMTLTVNVGSSVNSIEALIYKLSNDYQSKIETLLNNFLDGGKIITDTNENLIKNSSQILISTTKQLKNDSITQGTLNALNAAIGGTSGTDFSNPIILNRYISFLTNQKILAADLGVGASGNIFGTGIDADLQAVIKNNYFVNSFSDQKQLFANGNLDTLNDVVDAGERIFKEKFYNSLGIITNGSNKIYFSKDSSYSLDFFKLLLGINNLIKDNYKNFIDYLIDQISVGEQAFVTWVRSDSKLALPNFGNDGDPQQNKDFEFVKNQVYLSNLNGYAYMNAPFEIQQNGFPVTDNNDKITYTTDTKYWNSAKFDPTPSNSSNSDEKNYIGFYGLQTGETNSLPSVLVDGTSNDTNVFSNNVWQNNHTNGDYDFTGAMYQFGSLQTYIEEKICKFENNSSTPTYLINTISEFQNVLEDFQLFNFELSTKDTKYADEVDKFLSETLYNVSTTNLNQAINGFLKFIINGQTSSAYIDKINKLNSGDIKIPVPTNNEGFKTIPDAAFKQYSGNLFTKDISGGNSKSKLFFDVNKPTNSQTQIVVTQINNASLKQIDTTKNTTPWTTLNITKSAFLSMLVNAALDAEIQNKGVEQMNELFAKVNVYDVRLNDSLPINIINNHYTYNEKDEK